MAERILLVSDDPSLQNLLKPAITAAGLEMMLATSGPEGLHRWRTESPSLLLVDAANAAGDGIGLTGRVRASEPPGTRLGIIAIGGPDPAVKLSALQAGADDYLSVPVHPGELMARVRRLLQRSTPRPVVAAASSPSPAVQGPTMGQVIAFYGAKGGVGTTTLAVNTAVALHRQQRRRVALVDGDLQFGDHRVFLDIGVDSRSIIDAVSNTSIDAELLSTVMVGHVSGIDVLLAPPSPEVADLVSAERHHMLQITEVLRSLYDYVVLDLDQRLDDHALDVLGIADRIMIVMNADLSCIKNVRLMVETMGKVGVPADRLALVMNRSNALTGVSVKSVEAVLKRTVEHMVVNDYRAAITGLNTGRPFQTARTDAGIGASIAELARRIDDAPHPHAATAPAGAPAGFRALTAGGRA